MNPESQPTPRRITAEARPEFPCWLWHNAGSWKAWIKFCDIPLSVIGVGWDNCNYTHWHPDQPTAPTCVPEADRTITVSDAVLGDAERKLENIRHAETGGFMAPVIPFDSASREALASTLDPLTTAVDRAGLYNAAPEKDECPAGIGTGGDAHERCPTCSGSGFIIPPSRTAPAEQVPQWATKAAFMLLAHYAVKSKDPLDKVAAVIADIIRSHVPQPRNLDVKLSEAYAAGRRAVITEMTCNGIVSTIGSAPKPAPDLFKPGTLRITNAEMQASVSLLDDVRRLLKIGAPIYKVGYFTPKYEVMAGWELRREVEHDTFDTIYTWKRISP